MAMLLNSKQRLELKTIQSWACCFEPERRFWAEIRVVQLEGLCRKAIEAKGNASLWGIIQEMENALKINE